MTDYQVSDVLEYDRNDRIEIAPELETVAASTPVVETLEKMGRNKYSQMGVSKGDELLGMVSYRSVVDTLLVISQIDDYSGDWTEIDTELATVEAHEIGENRDILELFEHLTTVPYVIVKTNDSCRIITDYDLMTFITESIEPFLKIEEIENLIRKIIRGVYDDPGSRIADEFESDSTGDDESDSPVRSISTVDECSFKHYEIIVSKDWDEKFDELFTGERDFTRELISYVGNTRNEIFHFRTEDRSQRDLLELELAARHVRRAEKAASQ
jgi:predicted transcriptional regulator